MEITNFEVIQNSDINHKSDIEWIKDIEWKEPNEKEIAVVPKANIKSIADGLHLQIKSASGASFYCASSDEAFQVLKLVGAKAASTVKSDLFLEVVSPVFQGEVLSLGFSVKSELGGLPTLLNAGATQFEYRI